MKALIEWLDNNQQKLLMIVLTIVYIAFVTLVGCERL